MQFSFDMQRALGSGWVVEAGYRATRGVHLPFNYNINQPAMDLYTPAQRSAIAAAIGTPQGAGALVDSFRPFPALNSISLFENAATFTYHSLQTKLERRFRSGLNLVAAYTWSKSIDDATDFASGDPSERVLNSMNRKLQKAVSSFDVPHRFTAAFNYLIPSAPAFKPLLGGWQVNGVITAQSAQPFTPYTSRFDPYRNESFNRLMVVGDPNSAVSAAYAYNSSAFTIPPAVSGIAAAMWCAAIVSERRMFRSSGTSPHRIDEAPDAF